MCNENRAIVWGQYGSMALVILSLAAMVFFAVTAHPHRAVLLLVALLITLGVIRIIWPWRRVRLWYASRHRIPESSFFIVLGVAIWVLSPFTALMGVG